MDFLNKANQIIESGEDFSLFKFENLNWDASAEAVWSIENLKSSQLFFGTLKKFNDPFEGQLAFSLAPFHHSKALSYLNVARKLHKNFNIPKKPKLNNAKRAYEFLVERVDSLRENAFKKVSGNMGICCFCLGDEAFEPWQNLLMWSHYAGGFTGFCIEFDGRQLIESLRSSSGVFVRPIDYSKDRPYFDAEPKLALLSNQKLVSDWSDRESLVDALVATKPHEWHYEREVRLLKLRHAEKCLSYPHTSIRRIILSERADKKLAQQVTDAVSDYKNIEICRAALDSHEYRLKLIPPG